VRSRRSDLAGVLATAFGFALTAALERLGFADDIASADDFGFADELGFAGDFGFADELDFADGFGFAVSLRLEAVAFALGRWTFFCFARFARPLAIDSRLYQETRTGAGRA
jgi:hypothetical protein